MPQCGIRPVQGDEAEGKHGVELRVLDVALCVERLGRRQGLAPFHIAQRQRRQLVVEPLPELALGGGDRLGRQRQQPLRHGDAAGQFRHRIRAVPPGLQRLRRDA